MRRLTVLFAALALLAAACAGAPVPASPSAALATATPAPATPAPATPAPSSAARLIRATVTFDGTTCSYAGPTVVPIGSVIEWTLVNTPTALDGSIGGGILVHPVHQGTMWEDVLAWHAKHPSLLDPPPWAFTSAQFFAPEDAAAKAAMRTLAGPFALFVGCAAEGDNPLVFPAVLIQVLKG